MKRIAFGLAVLVMATATGCESGPTVAPFVPPPIDGAWKGKPSCGESNPRFGEHTLTLKAHPGAAVDATLAIFILTGEFAGSANNSTYPLKGVFGRETYRIDFTVNVDKFSPEARVGVAQGVVYSATLERDLSAITIAPAHGADACNTVRLTR